MRTSALTDFKKAHREHNVSARLVAGGLAAFREKLEAEGVQSAQRLISAQSEHWGTLMPFSWNEIHEELAATSQISSSLLVVRAIAAIEGYLDQASGGLASMGHAVSKPATEEEESLSLLNKLSMVLGEDIAKLKREKPNELICLRFFVYQRNRFAHGYGNPSRSLRSFAKNEEFGVAWANLSDDFKGPIPEPPSGERDIVELTPAHSVLAAIVLALVRSFVREAADFNVISSPISIMAVLVVSFAFAFLNTKATRGSYTIGLLVLFSMATAFADVFLGQGLIDAGFSETAEKGEVQVQAQLQMLPIALLETLMLDTVCYGLAKLILVRRMRKLNTIKNKTEV